MKKGNVKRLFFHLSRGQKCNMAFTSQSYLLDFVSEKSTLRPENKARII